MPNWISTQVVITVHDRDTIDSFREKLDLSTLCRIYHGPLDRESTLEPITGSSGSYEAVAWTLIFDTAWLPPIDLFKKLEERASRFNGVDLEASWSDEGEMWNTWYGWLFDGDNFQVLETGIQSMVSDYDNERNQTQFPPEILGKPLNYYEYLDDRNKWAGNIIPTVDSELS